MTTHTQHTHIHKHIIIYIMKETVNVTASLGVFVRVRAGIDIVTRVATWELQALDPVTGSHYVKYYKCAVMLFHHCENGFDGCIIIKSAHL